MSGWVGVDLDGTLAHYDKWRGVDHIGEPVPAMMERVKRWLAEGHKVKIFTARVAHHDAIGPIRKWLESHGLGHLEVTNVKESGMYELWDDRVVTVEPNTGTPLSRSRKGLS